MAAYSLVVRNGVVVDGTGMPGRRADVGVIGDRIATIGRIKDKGAVEVDAEGHVVTPGFVDGHTHMDAQVFWDPMGTSSCWHGVTTAVMGNCGFTLAPARAEERHLVVENLERAEDIPAEALAAGLTWTWERFREYLDALERTPKGINYGAYIGHSALRTWAMGPRAFDEVAGEEDLALMEAELRDALAAGAMGFTTSRSANHVSKDGRPVASRAADWREIVALVSSMGRAGGGVFELSNESVLSSPDPEARAEYTTRLDDLAVATGVPVTFGVTSFGGQDRWRDLLALIDTNAARGGRMFGQSSGREQGALFSFKTWMPFDKLPVWRELRALPLGEQLAALRPAEARQHLVDAANGASFELGPEKAKRFDFDRFTVLQQTVEPNPSVAAMAAQRGVDPIALMIDLAVETDLDQFFLLVTGNAQPDDVETMLRHPRTVMTFTDSGAHVSQIINSSMHTHLLAYWVRHRQAFTLEEAVRMVTLVPATWWNLADRGLVRDGFVADLNVIDPETVAPEMPTVVWDLPAGAKRLTQRARGILATVVAGEVVLRDGEATGAHPGVVVRRGRRSGER